MNEVLQKGQAAKQASFALTTATTEERNQALELIADQLLGEKSVILVENERDLAAGKEKGLSDAMLDRIMLNEARVNDMAQAIRQLVLLKDPIGDTLDIIEKENGLQLLKKTVPIGVIGMIYEARPNVTVDAATISLKTGNAVILRGSSSAKFSNQALVAIIHHALERSALPVDAVQLIEDTSRETAKELFHLNDFLDVLIPRGGKSLIDTVVKESTVPVIETGAGNCHIYLDETADPGMAEAIVLNAKLQRPSVCNAVESLLIHEKWLTENGIGLLDTLIANGVEIYGDEAVCALFSQAKRATEEDWHKEYLGLCLSVKQVDSCEAAIQHINHYGTKHSEAIITENTAHAQRFQQQVDAAAVYHNASTRFTDGAEFGFGAEIGISTQKLHARGPMGLRALTSSKFYIYGNGQVRE
ncbi:glutamate-5-semialdehyde dehydrogenase [Lentibacillus sp. N15]|uniref:glutamate-5-semialdehyde dehydrogenase n=1 Tax=Lentibacillus songyuanensis TaxID=3136161 RepID=UPI0031B9F098